MSQTKQPSIVRLKISYSYQRIFTLFRILQKKKKKEKRREKMKTKGKEKKRKYTAYSGVSSGVFSWYDSFW